MDALVRIERRMLSPVEIWWIVFILALPLTLNAETSYEKVRRTTWIYEPSLCLRAGTVRCKESDTSNLTRREFDVCQKRKQTEPAPSIVMIRPN
jgi:hypothetical protein